VLNLAVERPFELYILVVKLSFVTTIGVLWYLRSIAASIETEQ
jgi:hypothetical protein